MKRIHLLRHAKSSWGDSSIEDVDRPLNDRGIKTAEFMASEITKAGCSFQHVFCSSALRAQSTIRLMSEQLPEENIQWHTEEDLYTFDSNRLHAWCRLINNSISDVMIVGHNPALTNFCIQLTHQDIGYMPTCAYAQLTATEAFKWSDVSEEKFKLTAFLKPKKIMKRNPS